MQIRSFYLFLSNMLDPDSVGDSFSVFLLHLSNLSLMIIFTRTLGWRVSFPLRQLNEIGFPISGIGIKIDITTPGASREGEP